MANLATSLVAQALQNKPGGMMIGGNHFPQTGSAFNNSGSRGGGFMDRRGRDDYGVSIFDNIFEILRLLLKIFIANFVTTFCSKFAESVYFSTSSTVKIRRIFIMKGIL